MEKERIRSMLLGVLAGDALGAPYEFHSTDTSSYDGNLHAWNNFSRFQGTRKVAAGQFTDDSEMMLTLARSIVAEKGWKREKVIQAYLDWANSGIPFLGKNTRELFKGVKTLKGYSTRYAEKFSSVEEKEKAQSNGSLMRSIPLAILTDSEAKEDIFLTNPSTITLEFELLYLDTVRMGLKGIAPTQAWNTILTKYSNNPIVQAVEKGEVWNVSGQTKGWIGFPLYLSLWVLKYFLSKGMNYTQCLSWVIKEHPKSDTDTNGAIVGGMVGAYIGLDSPEKYQVIFSRGESDIVRPREYQITEEELDMLATGLSELFSQDRLLVADPSAPGIFISKDKLFKGEYKVDELKEFLRTLGLKVSGIKAELIERLLLYSK